MCKLFKKKKANVINVPKEYRVVNNYPNNLISAIIYLGLKELDIHWCQVIVYPMDSKVEYENNYLEERNLKGYIVDKGGWYKIFLNKNLSTSELISVIAHELIHLKQYQNRRLKVIDKDNVVWEDKNIILNDYYAYEERPWEVEAFVEQNKLAKIINKQLFI